MWYTAFETLSRDMAKAIKRKVRRNRHRPTTQWMFGNGCWAPIIGHDMRVLHHFVRVDAGEPLQFQCLERDVYLRTFQPH